MSAEVVPGPTEPAAWMTWRQGSTQRHAGRRAVHDDDLLDAASHAWAEGNDGRAAADRAAVIPFRQSFVDLDAQQPETDSDDTVWWYHQKRRGGNTRDYFGCITYVGGAEGKRIRQDLTTVLAKLLTWATEHDFPQDKDAA